MDYQVGLSPSAVRDLQAIVRYISLDAPGRAVAFGSFLVSKCAALGTYPDMGRIVPEFGESDIREIVVRGYRIIYRVDHSHKRVDIVRFWHAAQGTPTLPSSL